MSRSGHRLNRRQWLGTTAFALSTCYSKGSVAGSLGSSGLVVGQSTAEKIGNQILERGGNAIDAAVAAAFASAIASPHSTGIGGYGLTAVIAYEGGTKIVAIDANTTAPKAMPRDLFRRDASGQLPPGIHAEDHGLSVGWLSAGVPGILAGLQLMIDRLGTMPLAELLEPSIALARNGIVWPKSLANTLRNSKIMQADLGSKKLYFPKDNPIPEGGLFKNLDLADLLTQLAKKNSVRDFYQGDIAQRIADAFHKNQGLVTADDLAEYQPKWIAPCAVDFGPYRVHTAPLTSGGLSVLQMLRTFESLRWNEWNDSTEQLHARIETMRIAWRDRLQLLGDPDYGIVPVERILSKEYAEQTATEVSRLVKSKALSVMRLPSSEQTGTIHLSAADHHGNFVSVTLTHGNAFGACVTVDGLGLTLGHGMSRFDPRPDHPNGPAPGKRPLHNMVPTIVTREGKPILAVGGTGGRKIPNGLISILLSYVVQEQSLETAMAAKRIHTDGKPLLSLEKGWTESESQALRSLGYSLKTEGAATMHAVGIENGAFVKASR